jgi:hypothetical protein
MQHLNNESGGAVCIAVSIAIGFVLLEFLRAAVLVISSQSNDEVLNFGIKITGN